MKLYVDPVLDTVVRLGAAPPVPNHVIAKPHGPICNLDCRYCFYLDKQTLYPDTRSFRMSDETLEAHIRQYLAQPGPVVDFAWQGGEPTLMGLDFFRRVLELQERHRPPGRTIRNQLQTNGTRLDEEWGRFLRQHGFLVGISIDGPRRLHDSHRRDRGDRGSFDRVMRGIDVLRANRVEFNLLCCVHRHNAGHALEIYDFFRTLGTPHWQFIPIVEPEPGAPDGVSAETVRPDAYADFMIALFDRWVRNDVGRVFIQLIETAFRVHAGHNAALCIFEETCGRALALEHNGDLYSCDHFVDAGHFLGNIHQVEEKHLATLPRQRAFGRMKRDGLPSLCRGCPVRRFCNGGCPKDRFAATEDDDPRLNHLCPAYGRIFTHMSPHLAYMARELEAGRSPLSIMARLRRKGPEPTPGAGRNDPCPCGSGLKTKKCCGRST